MSACGPWFKITWITDVWTLQDSIDESADYLYITKAGQYETTTGFLLNRLVERAPSIDAENFPEYVAKINKP